MSGEKANKKITSSMTVLEIVSSYKETEAVFRSYDQAAGECICCNALFETLKVVASKYDLNLEQLIHDLEQAEPGDQ